MKYANVGWYFGILNRRSQAYITYVCKPFDITYSEYVILHALYKGDGCSQDELARRLAADKGLVARTTKTLAAKGFIERVQDDTDRRLRRIYVTPKGMAVKEPLGHLLECWIDHITMDIDEELKEQTVACLAKVAEKAAALDIKNIYGKGEPI